jgi:hypothetical protein
MAGVGLLADVRGRPRQNREHDCNFTPDPTPREFLMTEIHHAAAKGDKAKRSAFADFLGDSARIH